MKRIYMNIVCISCCIVIILTSCQNSEPTYTITEPYEYPAVPGTDEWAELWDKSDSMLEVAKALEIPEEILKNMTTNALIESVVNYPFYLNTFASGCPKLGLKAIKEYCNGLQELYQRDDAIEKITIFIDEKLQPADSMDFDTKFKKKYAELILEDLQEIAEEEKMQSDANFP